SIMTFDADVEGETKDWHADNIDTFIGTNHMTGSFKYTKKFNKPMITAHMEANLFEFDRFVFAPLKTPSGRQNKTTATFLEQPRFDKTKIDYSPLQKFDLLGYFKIKNLSYLNWDIENVTFFLDIKNDKITVKDFVGDKKPTTYQTTFSIYISDAPRVEGNLTVIDADMGRMGGSVYGFERGKMAFQTKYQGAASSVEDLMQTLKATTEIKLNDVVFKGLSIQPIVENLKTRTHSDGLHAFLEKKLSSGETAFETAKATLDIDEGRFTISNAAMQNGDVTLNISGTGSLDTWKADIKNIISAETLPTDLPKVEFDFSGSMSNPVLKIDDEDIIAHYDTHWRELEEQEKARKEAEEKALKDRMDQAQAIVTKQISFLNTEVFPRIERYKPFGADAAFVKIYESADIESNDILKTLKQLASKAYRTYNDEDIDKINIQTSVFAPTLPELVDRLDATYFEDLKQHIRNEAKGIEAIYNNSQEKSVNYQNTLNSYTMRLMQIGSLVVLDHLDEVKTNKAKVVDALRNIADTYRQSTALLKTTDTLNSIAQLDAQYQKIKTMRQNAQENFEALNTALENMFIYIQDVVYFEQTGKQKTPQPV
ncbi:MAG: hypothetical protein J6X42_06020, partial [Alphaproteobacteria bacterium]|nr:hypothetical protein [Alphaproteobacteria bacterium]